jgi:hypothetical protein
MASTSIINDVSFDFEAKPVSSNYSRPSNINKGSIKGTELSAAKSEDESFSSATKLPLPIPLPLPLPREEPVPKVLIQSGTDRDVSTVPPPLHTVRLAPIASTSKAIKPTAAGSPQPLSQPADAERIIVKDDTLPHAQETPPPSATRDIRVIERNMAQLSLTAPRQASIEVSANEESDGKHETRDKLTDLQTAGRSRSAKENRQDKVSKHSDDFEEDKEKRRKSRQHHHHRRRSSRSHSHSHSRHKKERQKLGDDAMDQDEYISSSRRHFDESNRHSGRYEVSADRHRQRYPTIEEYPADETEDLASRPDNYSDSSSSSYERRRSRRHHRRRNSSREHHHYHGRRRSSSSKISERERRRHHEFDDEVDDDEDENDDEYMATTEDVRRDRNRDENRKIRSGGYGGRRSNDRMSDHDNDFMY